MPGLQGVIIATPTTAHDWMVRKAIDKGLHVFCEKAADALVRPIAQPRRDGCSERVGRPSRLSQPLHRHVPRSETAARCGRDRHGEPHPGGRLTAPSCSSDRSRVGGRKPAGAAVSTIMPRTRST
ncbi:Gfo/Idh/MocA family oxidoreductase [Novosphingobium colocasiae]